jgi:hypothetical protein
MSGTQKEWVDELLLLRGITESTGIIHEAQALQLRLWPRTILPWIAKSAAEVDLDAKMVHYKCQTNQETPQSDDHESRYQALGEWTQFLLGPSWFVSISVDGNLMHTCSAVASKNVVEGKVDHEQDDVGNSGGQVPLPD